MLHHTWTYQALVHDLLDMNLNRVKVEVQESEDQSPQVRTYDLDNSDAFWVQNVATPFQNIAIAVNTYLKEYKSALDEFNKMSGGMDLDKYDESQLLGRTKDLGSFVNTIPALREKKRIIDVHTNIATALLNQIKARELDTYFSLEENLITRMPQDKREMLAIIADPNRGTPEDKMRLFLMFYLCNENIPQAEMDQFEEALKKVHVDTLPLKYVKRTKAFNESMLGPMSASTANQNTMSYSNLRGLLQKVNVQSFGLGDGVTKQLGQLFTAGVKALLPTTKEFYVTRVADAIMEMKNDGVGESFHYLDPKVQKKMRQSSIPRRNTPFKEAIVFVIGGGNYAEYQNLQEYAKKHSKKIVYGSTEIVCAKSFLDELTSLSSKI